MHTHAQVQALMHAYTYTHIHAQVQALMRDLFTKASQRKHMFDAMMEENIELARLGLGSGLGLGLGVRSGLRSGFGLGLGLLGLGLGSGYTCSMR